MSQADTCLRQPGGGSGSPPPPGPPRETLFRQGHGVTYRIPALLHLPAAGSFLAFAEKRSSPRDEDAEYLVMRRGLRRGSSVQWGPLEELSALVLPGRRTMNPCPLYEAASDTVFLFCICVERGRTERCQRWRGRSAARLCFSASADGGRSWTPLRDVTDEAVGHDLARWATFAVGPGHGLQLGSGRLVVPAYAYYVCGWLCGVAALPCLSRQHALIFYSDDGGRSWCKGDPLGGGQTGECQVAEIAGSDSRQPLLYCNARTRQHRRAVAFSTDRGLRFGRPVLCKALAEPPRGCQGSVVSFAAPTGTRGAPTGTSDAPTGTGDVPNGAADAPAGTKDVPNGAGDAPNSARGSPNSTKAVPAGTRDVPTAARDAPNGTVDILTSTRDAPTGAGDGPSSTKDAPTSAGDAPAWLLYSHPTNRHHRRDLGIYLNPSPLDEAGWQHPWVLHPGPAGYSDLATCPDGVFGCLFECGTASACEEIAFCLFTLDSSHHGEQTLKAS